MTVEREEMLKQNGRDGLAEAENKDKPNETEKRATPMTAKATSGQR